MTLSDWNEYEIKNDNEALRTRTQAMVFRKEILDDLIEITSELNGEPELYHQQVASNPDLRRCLQEIPWVSCLLPVCLTFVYLTTSCTR